MPVSAAQGRQAVEHVEVRRGEYHDSVTLMMAGRAVATVPGVSRALVAMGTDVNRTLLADLGHPAPAAGPADLVIAFTAPDRPTETAALEALATALTPAVPTAGNTPPGLPHPRTTGAALSRTGAVLTLISTPGLAAVPEAMESLQYGASVVIFSDNVPVHHEIRLKDEAGRRGLLVMGPDCGTVVLHGTGLGFTNVTRPGPVSLVAASGTGAQHLMSLLDAAGAGIRHCLGVGGRDLTEDVAGRSTHAALDALAADDETELIAVVSKPPHPSVARSIEDHAARLPKPVQLAFLGPGRPTLTQTAETILAALGRRPPAAWPSWPAAAPATAEPKSAAGRGRTIRGLFSGGTLCAEAEAVLTGTPCAIDLTDFGDDAYTRGRPHPMIDNTVRLRAFAEAAEDPEVGVVLLDVVLGRGAHADPAGELASAVRRCGAPVVVSLCGTAGDPQGLEHQARAFAEAGASVYLSNAEAATAAARLAAQSEGSL
ncbi:MAG: FdrA family protein [Catenulispora sp.]|nr:FdrA family protein [Catenulispora sp.]